MMVATAEVFGCEKCSPVGNFPRELSPGGLLCGVAATGWHDVPVGVLAVWEVCFTGCNRDLQGSRRELLKEGTVPCIPHACIQSIPGLFSPALGCVWSHMALSTALCC